MAELEELELETELSNKREGGTINFKLARTANYLIHLSRGSAEGRSLHLD